MYYNIKIFIPPKHRADRIRRHSIKDLMPSNNNRRVDEFWRVDVEPNAVLVRLTAQSCNKLQDCREKSVLRKYFALKFDCFHKTLHGLE